LVEAFPIPTFEDVIPLDLVCDTDPATGEGPRILGLGTPVCGSLLTGICSEIWATSASLCSNPFVPGFIYVPCLLLRGASPGRVGGSKSNLYDAILLVALLSPHYFFRVIAVSTNALNSSSRVDQMLQTTFGIDAEHSKWNMWATRKGMAIEIWDSVRIEDE
jgi:hypothetical protein